MTDEPAFRPDLYAGTAPWYDRYRPGYPPPLLDGVCRRAAISGSGRLLDLACGTGQIAFALAPRFAQVVAVDQEGDAIALAREKAAKAGLTGIEWITGAIEDVDLDGTFELITIGNAFHRVDRRAVARRMAGWLRPGGHVALLWSDTPWQGDRPWQRAMARILTRWRTHLDVVDRVPTAWRGAIEAEPHAEVLRRAGLVTEAEEEVVELRRWTVEELIGFVYSTSFLGRQVLGRHAGRFERDLRRAVTGAPGDGELVQDWSASSALFRLPGR